MMGMYPMMNGGPMNRGPGMAGPRGGRGGRQGAGKQGAPGRGPRNQNMQPNGQPNGPQPGYKFSQQTRNRDVLGQSQAPNASMQVPAQPNKAVLTLQELAAAPEEEQKQMIGEALYPKIANTEPELAGKITGMLLEMDNTELLALLSDTGALNNKVQEAVTVYNEYVRSSSAPGGESSDQPADGTENAAA